MTDRDAINTLEMENGLILFNPTTGEDIPYESLNEINRACYDAHIVAISALQKREERSKGCGWCNEVGKTPENWGCSIVGEFGTVTTADNEVIWTTADFCPKCGRPLKGGAK